MPCPGPFHFSHSVDYIYEFCPLPDPAVGPSIFVCDVEHTSFHFGLCGRKFVLCLFGQCPGLCTICHSWQHTGVVHLSLQADGKVAFEDIPVFGVCRPACHDSSLYLFVLVLFLEAVVLSQVHVAWDIFYQHIVHVYRGVVYNHHLCLGTIDDIKINTIIPSSKSYNSLVKISETSRRGFDNAQTPAVESPNQCSRGTVCLWDTFPGKHPEMKIM